VVILALRLKPRHASRCLSTIGRFACRHQSCSRVLDTLSSTGVGRVLAVSLLLIDSLSAPLKRIPRRSLALWLPRPGQESRSARSLLSLHLILLSVRLDFLLRKHGSNLVFAHELF